MKSDEIYQADIPIPWSTATENHLPIVDLAARAKRHGRWLCRGSRHCPGEWSEWQKSSGDSQKRSMVCMNTTRTSWDGSEVIERAQLFSAGTAGNKQQYGVVQWIAWFAMRWWLNFVRLKDPLIKIWFFNIKLPDAFQICGDNVNIMKNDEMTRGIPYV